MAVATKASGAHSSAIPPLVVCGILPLIPKVRRCVKLVLIRVSREEFSGLNPEGLDNCCNPPETLGAVVAIMRNDNRPPLSSGLGGSTLQACVNTGDPWLMGADL